MPTDAPDPSPEAPPTVVPSRDDGQSPWWIVGASFTGLAMGAMLAGGLIGVLEATEAHAAAPRYAANASAALAAPAPASPAPETSAPDLEADPEVHGDEVLDESVDVDAGPALAALPSPGSTSRTEPAPAPHPTSVPIPARSARARVTSDDVPEGPVQGYIHGRPTRIQVTRIDGKPVERHTAGAFVRMRDAAARVGVHLRIVSGFRTMEHQQALYRAYRLGRGNLAAVPGTSNHQSGHALDLNTSAPGVLRWLDRHARAFGFRRTVPTEAWHWEYW